MSLADKLLEIERNVPKVFAAGYDNGVEAGVKAEYDRFWDAYQQNGNRTDYTSLFSGAGWNAQTFRPKYDIVPIIATQMFSKGFFGGNLVTHLSSLGRTVDFSQATALTEVFYNSAVTRVGAVDTRSASNLGTLFYYAQKLISIDLLILKDDGSQTLGNNAFAKCAVLTNLVVQGKIGNAVSFQTCYELSKASITSIINALHSGVTGKSITFTKDVIDKRFETSAGARDGSSSAEWAALANTKTNWTINLV